MATNARYKLIEVITSNSVSKDWEHAVQEWSMTGCRIDRSCSSSCVCGQENIPNARRILLQRLNSPDLPERKPDNVIILMD